MARLTNIEIEKRWYDLFCGWEKSDRAAAIKALTQLHPRLPDNPKTEDEKPEQITLPGLGAGAGGADLTGANLTDAIRWDGAKYVPVTAEGLTERKTIL